MKTTFKKILILFISLLLLSYTFLAFALPAFAVTVPPPATKNVYLNGYLTDHLYITVTADVIPSFDIRNMPGLTYKERWGYKGDDGLNYMVYSFIVSGGGSHDGIQYTYNFRGSYNPEPDNPVSEEVDYIAYTFYITLYNYSQLAPDIGENPDPEIPMTYLYGYPGDVISLYYDSQLEQIEGNLQNLEGLTYNGSVYDPDSPEGGDTYHNWTVQHITKPQIIHTIDILVYSDTDEGTQYVLSRRVQIILYRFAPGTNADYDAYTQLLQQFTADDGTVDYFAMYTYLTNLRYSEREAFYKTGFDKGKIAGFNDGYNKGLTDAVKDDITFYGLLKTIITSPVTALRDIFNFEIAMPNGGSLNLFGVISFIVTMILVVFVISKLRGK